jgi:lysophospholipase L1-like esterase
MHMQNKNLLIATLCLGVSIISVFNFYYFFIRRNVGLDFYLNKFYAKNIDCIVETHAYKDLVEEYRNLNLFYKNKTVTVFVGDSITKRFNTDEFFPCENILNRGIYSDTTFGLLNRLDENINNLQIEKLFVLIGYNDLIDETDTVIFENIKLITKKSKAKYKFIQSILPVGSKKKDLNFKIDKINHQLREQASLQNYIFVDLNSELKDENGGINRMFSGDGVHLNYEGYKVWFTVIKKYIK